MQNAELPNSQLASTNTSAIKHALQLTILHAQQRSQKHIEQLKEKTAYSG